MGPGTTDPHGGDFLSPQIQNQDRYLLGDCYNTRNKSLAHELRNIIVEKAKRKKLQLPNSILTRGKLENQRNIGWGVGNGN